MEYNSQFDVDFKDKLRRYIPSPTHNIIARDIFQDIENKLSTDSTVLIVGSGDKGGEGISGLSSDFLKENVYGIDIRSTKFTDILGDGKNLPFPESSIDAIINQAVLEHVDEFRKVIEEFKRVLRPGGFIYIDVPFIQGYHALPTDYRRFTVQGLRQEMSSFTEIRSGVSKGPTSAWLWVNIEYISYILSFGNPYIRKVWNVLLRMVFFWTKYVDILLLKVLGESELVLTIPSAVYWFGENEEPGN